MLISKVTEYLDKIYDTNMKYPDDRVAVHLVGPPGIGKTAVVREWSRRRAARLDRKFIDLNKLSNEAIQELLTSDYDNIFIYREESLFSIVPEDFSGLPDRRRDMGISLYLPLAYVKLFSKYPGVLFLDEYANEERRNMIAASYRITRDNIIGYTSMHPGVFVVAASNSLRHSSIANPIPKPARDRFWTVEVDADKDGWIDYMNRKYGDAWDRRVLAYHMKSNWVNFIANIDDDMADDGFTPPATPRGWTWLSLVIYGLDDLDAIREFARGKVGAMIGDEFVAFISVKLPRLEEVFKRPEIFADLDTQAKYMLLLEMARKTPIRVRSRRDRELLDGICRVLDFIVQESGLVGGRSGSTDSGGIKVSAEHFMAYMMLIPGSGVEQQNKRLLVRNYAMKNYPRVQQAIQVCGSYIIQTDIGDR